jgi:NADH-quinone oxidoreductase subunit A
MPLQELLRDYLPIAILLGVATGLAIAMVTLGQILGPRKDTPEKLMPYESGMIPIGTAMRRMPVRYYLIAVLFVLFDIEVIFLLPYAVVLRKLGVFGLIEMLVFVTILLVGYIYVWKKGALEWE